LLAVKVSPDLQEDAELLCAAVRAAGALGLDLMHKKVRNWPKSDGSVVTEADLAINDFLYERLQKPRPNYGWLSEESPIEDSRLDFKRLWVVDPIDGTRSFIAGTDGWCIGVALIENGRPILSALFRPMIDEFYFAAKGAGAWRNTDKMRPRDGVSLVGAELLGTGKAIKILGSEIVGTEVPHIPLLLRLALVASGQADIALSIGQKNDWDLAAGDLLMRESGATLTTIDGQEMIYNRAQTSQNGMVAAGPLRHKAAMKKLETT
jgi:myo-inositol-1(or 4)-monophosphatase